MTVYCYRSEYVEKLFQFHALLVCSPSFSLTLAQALFVSVLSTLFSTFDHFLTLHLFAAFLPFLPSLLCSLSPFTWELTKRGNEEDNGLKSSR